MQVMISTNVRRSVMKSCFDSRSQISTPNCHFFTTSSIYGEKASAKITPFMSALNQLKQLRENTQKLEESLGDTKTRFVYTHLTPDRTRAYGGTTNQEIGESTPQLLHCTEYKTKTLHGPRTSSSSKSSP